MVKKTLNEQQSDSVLDELFKIYQAKAKAEEQAEKAEAKANLLKRKYDQLANETDLQNRLYTDVSSKVWFFNGYRFTPIQAD